MRKRDIFIGLPAALAIITLTTLPAYARGNDDNSGKPTTVSATTDDGSGAVSDHDTPQERTEKVQQLRQEAAQKADDLRARAKQAITDLKQEHKERTQAERQKNCQERKTGLLQKVSELNTNAQKRQTRITDVLNKTLAYQSSNNLTVQNFDSLVAAANSAKDTAATSVQALGTLQPTIDCASSTTAQDVAAFKAAAATARDDLIAYKKAVQALLSAVEAAKSEGSNQ